MNSHLLHLDNVSYSYSHSDWKLDKIDLSIGAGEFIGIVGSNGSGKSTLLKLAAGLLSPDAGQVLLENTSIQKIPRRKLAQNLGYLPQQIQSVFDLNAKEVVSMGRFCHSKGLGLTQPEDIKIVDYCMEVTETNAFQDRSINDLSGGERQRVFLASVLAQQPAVMLLDEPVTGLDLQHQVSFFKLLSQFSIKGMAVVVITHDLNLASQFCSKILLLNNGKKEIYDSAESVFDQINRINAYSEDIALLRHPVNQKPAVLPLHTTNRESAEK